MNSEAWLSSHDRAMERLARTFAPFKVDLPEGESGNWKVERFEVVKGIGQLRCAMDGRPVPLGFYTRLSLNEPRGGLFMTDTPAELNDARDLIWKASGHLLITGLGIGMIPRALFNDQIAIYGGDPSAVEKITIVEQSADVIALVGSSLDGLPVEIVNADAFDWTPPEGTRFDWAWHDIWPSMDEQAWHEAAKLRRRYSRFMAAPKRQLVWGELDRRRSY